MRHLFAAVAAALLLPIAAAQAASLPAVKRSVSASGATNASCYEGLRSGKGIATTTYRAPMSGFVDVRSAGTKGDWDLALYDVRNPRRAVQGSNGFDSREVTQSWATAGQRFTIQACRRAGASRSLPLAITFTDAVAPKSDMAPQMLRITVARQDLGKLEALGVDVTHSVRVGSVDALVSSTKQLQSVRSAGFKYRVLDANVLKSEARQAELSQKYAAATARSPLPTGRTEYRNLEDYEAELKSLVKQHPDIARPVELPHKSFQGRPLMGVELSDNVAAKDDGKPTYFVMGTHHAREWPAGEIAMEWAWYVANGYGSDDQVTNLLKR
jgi:hypothetical protein